MAISNGLVKGSMMTDIDWPTERVDDEVSKGTR